MIFVFGSNEAGRHGAGAAAYAEQHHGARYAQGFGPAGSSFAIPTKDWNVETLPLPTIKHYVERFIVYAQNHLEQQFKVTAIGCGLAGYTHAVIAPLFAGVPDGCFFDERWRPFLPLYHFWGTYK
jgi:hypothetical protein